MFKAFIKNPIMVWIKRTIANKLIEREYVRNKLKIGYMCLVQNTTFGFCNTIYEKATLVNVALGDFTYIASGTAIRNTTIGKFCSIGPEILIGLGKHPTSMFVSTHPLFFSTRGQAQEVFCDCSCFNETANIIIGNDVWIGARAIILDGVTIGDGAIVAAGSLVNKDVPPYAIVGGVPAKVIKYRFETFEIEWLLRFKWWDKSIDWLRSNYKSLQDVKVFIANNGDDASSAEMVQLT